MSKKALIAMSGGVDSSVAALLMKNAGYECVGAMMRLWGGANEQDEKDAACVAARLDMPFYVFDLQKQFKEKVIRKFISVYESGATPNPCLDCNRYLKFGALYEKAIELGCDVIATGHYVTCVREDGTGRYLIQKAADPAKDQSYVLYSLSQEFTVDYELTGKKFMSYTASGYGVEGWYIFGTWLPSPDFKDEYADLSGYSVADNGLYFGIKYLSDNLQLHTVGGGMSNLTSRPASEHVPSEFIQRFTHAGESLIPEGNALTYTYGSDLEMLDLKVKLTGEYSEHVYETTFVIAGYTNTSTLTGMDVSEPAVVF